jgi:hypothetical protein
MLCDWSDQNGYPISGCFELRAGDSDTFLYWFGTRLADQELAQFGAGADGSLYCIWSHPSGTFPIIHLGSEGDSIMVLASDFRSFITLLAIGYDEIGFDDLSEPPTDNDDINPRFQKWAQDTFNLTIPKTGKSIIDTNTKLTEELNTFVSSRIG